MKKLDRRIEAILKRRSKEFDKKIRKSELLARNVNFLKELKNIRKRLGRVFFRVKDIFFDFGSIKGLSEKSEHNPLLKLRWPKPKKGQELEDLYIYTRYDESKRVWLYNDWRDLQERIDNKFRLFTHFLFEWREFCGHWGVDVRWDGSIRSLTGAQKDPVEIYCGDEGLPDRLSEFRIVMTINEWATLEDIRAKWSTVQTMQKKIWGKRESATNFGRDLCWYDLAEECKLKPSQIAKLWVEKYPADIDLLVIRGVRKHFDENDMRGRVLDDSRLITEVKSGFLSAKYAQLFEQEKAFYVSGKISRGGKTVKVNPPFVDVIKKAINRMEAQIKSVHKTPHFGHPVTRKP